MDPEKLPSGRDWHRQQAEEVLRQLDASADGLPQDEAAARLQRHGPNRLPAPHRQGPLKRLLLQFHNLLIYVLLGAMVVAYALGEFVDGTVILLVVIANAVIGFVQEGRAEQALQAISAMMQSRASVLRDGGRVSVDAEAIVPGDIVLVEAGDKVPADLRLVRARNLRVEEAVLTGESMAVDKQTGPVAAAADLGDRSSMAYSGTLVTAGQGAGVVVATGAGTELGRISELIGTIRAQKTPLLRQIDRFGRQLTVVILVLAAVTFAAAYLLRGYTLDDSFMLVVGLAVAAIPEGLPAILTITMAIGVQRMAARRAIVRRLPAVETLGSVTVICSDKTGTLTRNEMAVAAVAAGGSDYEIIGVGYSPAGSVRTDGAHADPERHPGMLALAEAATLCNDAALREADGGWTVEGDAMEGALLVLAHRAGIDPQALRKRRQRLDEVPFDAQHRFMATLHEDQEQGGGRIALIKGAPERVLAMCDRERAEDGERPLDAEAWRLRAEAMADRGQRVLAFAYRRLPPGHARLEFDDVTSGTVLLGLTGLVDPPRAEAVEAVAACHTAGIRVIMITGDHAGTARAIATELGLGQGKAPTVLSGRELEELDDDALRRAARETAVFARTTPEHKLRLVGALQAGGDTVAMTGDGVNDAPAVKRADVGIAMGGKGTEVAKEAAEIVLTDDNFASIVAAVREGRTVYDNLTKVISWTLPTNGGEALTLLAALALGVALPITPLQILWVNLITAVALGLTLAFEPTEAGTMRKPPRPPGSALLSGELAWRVVFVSLLFVAGAFGVFNWAISRELPIETARTMVVNTIVVLEIFYLFSIRYVHGASITFSGVVGTRAVLTGLVVVIIAQLLLTYLPPLQSVFETRPLNLGQGALIVGVGIAMFVVVELEKRIRASLRR